MDTFDPTLASLEPALGLLRHDWVHKFFFETSKTDRLSQLNYALNSPVTMTGKLKVSASAPQRAPPPLQSEVSFLFAPSFSTGRLTVGFDVADRTTSADPAVPPGRHISRAVRDDEEGVFLAVTEFLHGITEVAFCTKVTPGCRVMVFMLIKTQAFRYVAERGFDEHIVRHNLVRTLYSLDARSCPTCGSALFNCTCRFSVIRKIHQNDFEGEIRNVDSYVGSFDGLANLRTYEGGRPSSITDCISTIQTSLTVDMNWKQALGRWAMRSTSESCSLNLVQLCMPDAGREQEASDPRLPETFEIPEGDDIGVPGIPSVDAFLDADDELLRLFASLQETENDFVSGISAITSGDVATSVNGRSEVERTHLTCSEGLTSSDDPMEARPHGEAVDARPCDEAVNETSGRGREQDRQKGVEIPPWEGSVPQGPSSAEGQNVEFRTSTGPPINVEPAGPSEQRAYVVERVTTKRLVPIAPSTGGSDVRASAFATELQRKAEVRKARNRASALRSNEKKRIHLEQLKEDIAEAGRMEATLREKEKALREENLKLRASIYR